MTRGVLFLSVTLIAAGCLTLLSLSTVVASSSCEAAFSKNSQSRRRCRSLATTPPTSQQQLLTDLQQCTAPEHVLDRVGSALCPNLDPTGHIARLSLVRLSKLLVNLNNQRRFALVDNDGNEGINETRDGWSTTYKVLANRSSMRNVDVLYQVLLDSQRQQRQDDDSITENLMEGIKAVSTISRLVPDLNDCERNIVKFLHENKSQLASALSGKDHFLSGLDWAVEGMRLRDDSLCLPDELSQLVADANLSFKIYPRLLHPSKEFSVNQLATEVDFRIETIRTASQKVVQERRKTAWQGDRGVGAFLYSGKSMPRRDWSPTVRKIRDVLHSRTGQYYDCCLLNLYPDGGSGMRYHSDPDQGTLWDYDTAVVSIGATRRFAFRAAQKDDSSPPHNFIVMQGDVTHMFGDCQSRFQHAVKQSEQRGENSPRVSLVYKRSLTGTDSIS